MTAIAAPGSAPRRSAEKAQALRLGYAGIAFPAFYAFKDSECRERALSFANSVNRLTAGQVICAPQPFRTAEEADRCAEQLIEQKVDAVVLDVCTFPEGKAWMAFVSRLPMPVILWSRPEKCKTGPVGHNSFCGANFIMANLRREGRRCRAWFGNPEDAEFEAHLASTLEILGAAKAAAGSRIGLVGGGIVPKFHDLDLSEAERGRLEQAWDIRFVTIPLDEVLARAAAVPASEAQAEASRQAGGYAENRVGPEAVLQQARLVLALRAIREEKNLATLAIRCWPELQTQAKFWPCGAIGHLCDAGIPTACEGDPVGALDMLLASKLSPQPSTLLDIIDFDDARDTLSLWHCGPTAPSCAACGKVALLPHAVDGADESGKPRFGHPAIHDLDLKPGPITILRTLGALDDDFRLEAEILPADGEHVTGSFAKAGHLQAYGRPIDAAEARQRILAQGIPHHYAVFYREEAK